MARREEKEDIKRDSNTHLLAVEDETLLVRRDARLLFHPLFDPNHLWRMMEM